MAALETIREALREAGPEPPPSKLVIRHDHFERALGTPAFKLRAER
jgi:hypothetical protein